MAGLTENQRRILRENVRIYRHGHMYHDTSTSPVSAEIHGHPSSVRALVTQGLARHHTPYASDAMLTREGWRKAYELGNGPVKTAYPKAQQYGLEVTHDGS